MNISRRFADIGFRTVCGVFAFPLLVSPLQAVSIGNVVVNNTSGANENVSGATTGRTVEFRTAVANVSPVSTVGLESEFSTQVSWFLGHEVDAGATAVANTVQRHVSYEVAFTVSDPGNFGYRLAVDSNLRGYLTSVFDSGAQTQNGLQANGTGLFGRIDTGAGYGSIINNLTVTPAGTEVARANYLDVFDNVLVTDEASYNGGEFFGTRTFRLQFSSRPSPNVTSIVHNDIYGRNGIRYGLNPTDGDLSELLTPGADGEAASDLGHFVNVSVTANAAAAVPEMTSTLGCLAMSVGGIFLARRKMK